MLGQEKPQDFELIELLIREAAGVSRSGPSTSAQQKSDFESFKARFQSYIDQIPSYLHSVGKEGFFPHFFLGSFSILPDTEIAGKLGIKKVYFRFDTAKTLKIVVVQNDQIKKDTDVIRVAREEKSIGLFSISEDDGPGHQFTSGELEYILKENLHPDIKKEERTNTARGIKDRVKGRIKSKLVQINRSENSISVEMQDKEILDFAASHNFHEIKKEEEIWKDPEDNTKTRPEDYIAELTDPNVEEVKKSSGKVLSKISEVHSKHKGSFIYADQAREAAHHGFIAGALVNFRYRYNLRVYLEQFAGRGYADIVLVPRGKDRSLNAVPIIIELKAGTSSGTTSNDALEQAKDYAKGFQPNTMRVLTISDNVLCVGLNLDSTESEKFSMYVSPREDREIAPPTIQALLKEASDWNGREDIIKEKIKQPLERIYHTFPGTPEKGGNYFSRFLLGQLLLANEFKRINLEKSVFLYNEYPLASSTRSGAQSTERPVTTFMLTKGNQGQDKEVFIFHIREGGKGEFSEKKIPINLPTVSKITEVCISLQEERKSDFFNVEEVNRYNSLDEYRQGKSFFGGEWKNIPYPAGLKKTFDEVLKSQLASSQDQSQSIGKYKELFGKLGETVLPFKVLIEKEAHTQAISHGAFSHYSDIKLGKLQENRALVLTEFQTGRGKRIDMLVHGIKFADQASSAKEYDPVGLELKGPREGKTADALKDEANKQIADEYKKGVTYKTLTDGKKVDFIGVVFDKGANNADSLILMSKDAFTPVKVVHSSIFSISQQQCSKGRRTRSIGIPCIDSRDEEKITEKEKEQRIKELFGIDNVRDFNTEIEAYGNEIITVDSKRVHTITRNSEEHRTEVYVTVRDDNGNDKKLIIDDVAKMWRIENYMVVSNNDNYEIWLRDGSKHYVITEKMEGQNIEYYLGIDGYKVKLDSIIKDFTADAEKKAIHDKLHQLSNKIELYENKKYIEDIGGAKDIEVTNQDYDHIINEIKQNLLKKGVSENAFDQFKSHFDDLNEKVFAEYIGNVETNLEKQGIEFDRNKFNLAKIKGTKSGKFFSLMAIYDLFDSIGDTATLGRYDNDALKRVFGINGILDAMDDVRTSVSISHTSKVGKLISKIPQPVRQTFVKIISNPVVQSITFATIAYQFGYSVNEIAQGNHHPLNYYWTISSGVKLASMGIRPISTGISFAIKSVSTTTKILRGLSAAGKVLGRAAVVTMVADVLITIGVEIHERMEYTKAIAEQVPLLPGDEQAEVFFAKVIKFFTGRDVEKEYEDIIRVKGYLNHVKEVAIKLLDDNYNIAAIVQYVISIEEKYSEVVKTVEEKHMCVGRGLGCFDQWTCGLEKKYNNISFDKINAASNIKNDLSLLNISKALEMRPYTLVMSEGWERFICNVKSSSQCHQDIDQKEVYIVNTDAKHIPHLTKYEYEDLGLKIVNAPLKKLMQESQCSNIINEERVFRPYALDKRNMPCNAEKIHRNCQKTFALSGEPFIFTNPTRKDPYHIRKETFPKDSVLYISGPRTLTAAANYPAVMYVPEGHVSYVGSKNNGTTFIANNPISGLLEGGVEKENTVAMNVKANNIVADLHNGAIYYGNSGNIKLINIYNYASNSDSKQDITTHCKTRLINAKNAEVRQNSFNCVDKDYEVRVVNKENVHHRGLKQTIFVVNEDSDNARIVSDLGSTRRIKENIDIIDVRISDITKLKINENTERNVHSLDLLGNNIHSVVSSVEVSDFKNLVIQAKRPGITESVIIQDKSFSDIIEDMRYKKLNDLGKDINREVIQNSGGKLKAVVQTSILDSEWANTYQIAKGIASYNNLGIPISQIEVVKNYTGVPTEKTIIAGMYSDQIVVDFGYSNPNFIRGTYYYYVVACNYYQDITVEGGGGPDQYVVKLPEYSHILQQEDLRPSMELDLNLRIRNKAVLYQNIPDDIIDLTALNVTDVNSINMKKGRRSYFNKCYNRQVSDLTVDSLEIKDVKVSISEGVKWSLSIGLVDYFRGLEYQSIVLRINNKFYKINNANLKLEHVEANIKPFRYYQPDKQGLQIYHNQPTNKNVIGLVNLKEKSILDFDIEIVDNSLLLLHQNNTITKVENWNAYQPARKMMFAFNDAIVSNSNCIAFTCNSEDVIADFNKAKEILLKEQLFNAIKQNNTNEVKILIRKIADNIDTKNKHELTPLYIAVQEGRLDVVELLFNGGSVSVKDKDIHGYSPLHWAAQEGESDIAKFFLDKGANIEDQDNSNRTPLYSAIKSDKLDTVKFFLGRGANIDVRDKGGKAPLDLAIQENYVNIIEILRQAQLSRELFTAVQGGDFNKVQDLVKQGASLKTKDKYSNTLLHCASWSGQLSIVKYLTEEGASLEAKNHRGKTPLHEASWDDCLSIVKYLVENGANFEAKDKEGSTPLHYASRRGQLNIVRYLVENKANFNTKDHNEGTPLHNASRNNYLKVVEYLVENGADFEAKDYNSRTPVHDASLNGNLDIVKYFAKEWANLEAKDKNGKTPLDLADQKGYTNIVKILKQALLDRELLNAARNSNLDKVKDLIKDGASLEAKDWHGSTPLHHASLNGNLDMVEYLIRQNVTLDVQNLYGSTPVHDASWSGHLKVVEYLIENKADFEVEDKYGQTPLHDASRNGHLKVVECLIEKGASLVTDKYGRTPLDLASQKGYTNIVEFLKQVQLDRELFTAIQDGNFNKVKSLVNQNADVNTNDEYGWTPLHFAAFGNKFDIVEFLFDKNATIKAKDVYGNTPLHVAAQYSSKLEIVEFLLDKDASGINNITNDGWTPLHIAVQGNKPNTVKLFLNRKASIGVKDKYGITPLGLAVQKGYTNIVQMIEQAQLNLDKELLTVAQDGDLSKIKDLIIQGANLNAQNEDGTTPLDIARDKGYSDIVEYLERKLNEKEEKPTQRKHRHHHGDHSRHHLSRKPLAIDSSNQPEIAASSGTRPSSWINDLFSWVKISVGGLFYSRAALSEETLNTTSSISQVDAPMDVNGTIMLLDVLVRKVTGQKYISTVDQSISPLEAQGYALNITKRFEKVLNETAIKSGISVTNLNFDPVAVQSAIVGQIISEKFSKIPKALYSFAKEACPEFKQTDKFLVHLRSQLEVEKETALLQQKVEKPSKILDQQVSGKVELSKKPDTFLNGTSVVKGISNVLER